MKEGSFAMDIMRDDSTVSIICQKCMTNSRVTREVLGGASLVHGLGGDGGRRDAGDHEEELHLGEFQTEH